MPLVYKLGIDFMLRLSNEDGRAVDMLLDSNSAPNGANGENKSGNYLTSAQPANIKTRLEKVGTVLSLLDALPAADPPADLLNRLLTRIDSKRSRTVGPVVPDMPQIPNRRPHA